MPKVAGFAALLFLAFFLMGGCGGGHDKPTPQYTDSTTVTSNPDGGSTYHSKDSYGGDFSCTFHDDGSSDCSGKP